MTLVSENWYLARTGFEPEEKLFSIRIIIEHRQLVYLCQILEKEKAIAFVINVSMQAALAEEKNFFFEKSDCFVLGRNE